MLVIKCTLRLRKFIIFSLKTTFFHIFFHQNRNNELVDELMENPSPDYEGMLKRLKAYKDDPRALNLQGVIEYRCHHRHAAERAFAKAARMGDMQALTNLEIIEYNRSVE